MSLVTFIIIIVTIAFIKLIFLLIHFLFTFLFILPIILEYFLAAA